MSEIEWTDHTTNVQIGCTRVSAGCVNCYAEAGANSWPKRNKKVHGRYLKVVDGKGRWNHELYLDEAMLALGPKTPHRKKTASTWRSTRVFIGSMTDHFHEKVTPEMFAKVMLFMAQRPDTIWQLVTKRPERARGLLLGARGDYLFHRPHKWEWPRIHLLTTVEDQQRAEERVPRLLECEPYVELLGLSVEPLLERVELAPQWLERLGWVIVGGESGPKARGCDVEWIRSVVEQTRPGHRGGTPQGTPCFVKQLGARAQLHVPHVFPSMVPFALKHPKGGLMSEWPTDLQVQEFPR